MSEKISSSDTRVYYTYAASSSNGSSFVGEQFSAVRELRGEDAAVSLRERMENVSMLHNKGIEKKLQECC